MRFQYDLQTVTVDGVRLRDDRPRCSRLARYQDGDLLVRGRQVFVDSL